MEKVKKDENRIENNLNHIFNNNSEKIDLFEFIVDGKNIELRRKNSIGNYNLKDWRQCQ